MSLETHIQKEPTIRNSYQFPNVPSHEWQHWKVDNGSSILSGLVVKLYNSKWLKYCVMILLVARREAGDNNDHHRSGQRQTFNVSVKSMGISYDHFIYCIVLYKYKTIFSICGSIFSIIH